MKVRQFNDIDDPFLTDQVYGDNTPAAVDYGEGDKPARNSDEIGTQMRYDEMDA